MKLIKDSALYVFGEIFSRATPFLLLPYLTRALGAEEYGLLSIYRSWLTLLSLIILFAFDASIIRYAYYYGKRSLKKYINFCVNVSSLIFFLLISVALLLKFNDFVLVLFCAYLQSIFKLLIIVYQSEKRAKKFVLYQFSFGLISMFFTVLLFEMVQASYSSRILSMALAYFILIVIGISGVYNVKLISYRIYKKYFYYALSFCSPLLIYQIISYTKGQFDRVFLSTTFSSFELGIYSAGHQIASILLILTISMSRGVEPYVYEFFNKNDGNFKLNSYVIYIIPLVLIFPFLSWCVPEEFFIYLIGNDFIGVHSVIFLFVCAFSVNLLFIPYSFYFTYKGNTAFLTKVNIVSLVFYLILLYYFSNFSILLVPYATIISNVVLIFMCIIKSKRYQNESI